jgi:single-stranded-DNA-specific exonuclease
VQHATISHTVEAIIKTHVAGVTYENPDGTSRQEIVETCRDGEELFLLREPDNEHDPNAIAVVRRSREQCGYIPAELAENLAPSMDAGVRVDAIILERTGDGQGDSFGLEIELTVSS